MIDDNGDRRMIFRCDDAQPKTVSTPNDQHIDFGGIYGHHQHLVKQRLAWQTGWRQGQRNEPIPDLLADNWLVMYPITYEFRQDRRADSFKTQKIFVCLESEGPMYFSKADFHALERVGDARIQKMELDPETGYYIFDPGTQ